MTRRAMGLLCRVGRRFRFAASREAGTTRCRLRVSSCPSSCVFVVRRAVRQLRQRRRQLLRAEAGHVMGPAQWTPLALHGVRDDRRRPSGPRRAARRGLHNLAHVVPVNDPRAHPKAAHLSASGSSAIISSVGPVWYLLRSTMAIRLSSRWCAAAMAASQFEPSCNSPWPGGRNATPAVVPVGAQFIAPACRGCHLSRDRGVHGARRLIHAHPERDADTDRQPVAQRPGRYVDPGRHPRARVAGERSCPAPSAAQHALREEPAPR